MCDCGSTTLPTGPAGANGFNAFTVTTASFIMPTIGASVNIAVSATNQYTGVWAALGQVIYITDGTRLGYFEVTTAGTQTTIGVKNLGYTGNSAPAAVFSSGSKVSPGGLQGTTGTAGTNGVAVLKIDHTPVEVQTTSYTTAKTLSLTAATTFSQNEDAIEIEMLLMSDITSAVSAVADFRLTMSDGVNPAITLTEAVDQLYKGAGVKYRMVVDRTAADRVTPYKEASIGNSVAAAYAAGRMTTTTALEVAAPLAQSGVINFANTITLNLDLKVANIADKIKVIYWKVTHLKK